MKEKLVVTHSSMHTFMSCRQKYDFRYNKNIVSCEKAPALSFGTAVHAGLEFWFKFGLYGSSVEATTRSGIENEIDEADLIKAQELVKAYIKKYQDEDFDVKEIEYTFESPVRNPKTKRISPKAVYSGKIDGLIEKDGELWILEHKTSSNADEDYFLCKDFDDQIALYAIAIEEIVGRPVVGALYDVIIKPRLIMSKGETDEEYAGRVFASKTGKVKRKEAESPEDFRARCAEAITENNFFRKWIRFDPIEMIKKRAAFWSVVKDMRTGQIYQNTFQCLGSYSPCEYRHLCHEHGDLSKCADCYETRKPHEELGEPNHG